MPNLKINKKEEAYYWPLWFSKSLNIQEQAKAKKIIKKIQIAQVCLWRAFNIYDDFLDKDRKAPELLKANNYFRRYLDTHYKLKLPTDYYRLLNNYFNKLGEANKKELDQEKLIIKDGLVLTPKKIPKRESLLSLADKSFVLALGPIAILSFLGYKIKSKRVQSSLNFFRCALAAKQLSDDGQDWLVDLKAGRITGANMPILISALKTGVKLDFKNNLAVFYLLFASEAAPKIIKDLKTLCCQAEILINKGHESKNTIIFNKLIKPIQKACQKAQTFRNLVLEN